MTRSCVLPLLLFLIWENPIFATQPTAVIDQGASVTLPSGGGVFLSAKKSTGEGPKLWHVGSIVGFLESDGFPLVGPRDGTYQVELLVLGMVDGKPASSSAACLVTVGGQPGPGPNPPNPPVPPLPPGPTPLPGKYGIAPLVYEWALQAQSTTRAADTQKLAGAMRGVSRKAKALADVQAVQNEWQNALGALKAAGMVMAPWGDWQVKFNAEIARQYALAGSGFKTPTQFGEFLDEAAGGLEAVR